MRALARRSEAIYGSLSGAPALELTMLLSLEPMKLSDEMQGRTWLLTRICLGPYLDAFLRQFCPDLGTPYLVSCRSLELGTNHVSRE